MRISAETFWAPKAGNRESEYEDAFCPTKTLYSKEGEIFRFAVADGATDSVFSGRWAKILTRAFYKGSIDFSNTLAHLSHLQRLWSRTVKRDDLPWYTLAKLEKGAFAALVGLTIQEVDRNAGEWSTLAVGDSCLFHLRDGRLIQSFPIRESIGFNNNPILVSSISHVEHPDGILQTTSGSWKARDTFYLMSDAIACWFLKTHESGNLAWRAMRDLTTDEAAGFRPWLDELRRSNMIRNDDVTISRIEIEIDDTSYGMAFRRRLP